MQPLHVRPAKGVRFAFALLVWPTHLSLQCLSVPGTSSLRADEARQIPKVDRNGSVMVQATALKAKLSGLLVEKPAVVQSVLETTATEVLLAMLAEYERRIAARELMNASHP